MARKKINYEDTFRKAAGNRGEEFNEPKANIRYEYRPADTHDSRSQERAIQRQESRNVYEDMYTLEQRRAQRSYDRTQDMSNEFYAGVDPRRKSELADGGMVRESRVDMANLPRQAIHCEYPRDGFYQTPYLDSIERGIEQNIDDNGSSMARYLNPYGNRPAY